MLLSASKMMMASESFAKLPNRITHSSNWGGGAVYLIRSQAYKTANVKMTVVCNVAPFRAVETERVPPQLKA